MDLCTKQSFVVRSKVRIDCHCAIQEYYELLIRQTKLKQLLCALLDLADHSKTVSADSEHVL